MKKYFAIMILILSIAWIGAMFLNSGTTFALFSWIGVLGIGYAIYLFGR